MNPQLPGDLPNGLPSGDRRFREQISVRTNHYSVPVRLIGRRVRVMLHTSDLVVYDEGVEVARHERLMTAPES
ncbi:Mu transposase domain-containing protein [Streptomyces sp. NBC_01236]|uniref:Mu transposase domain-containing protein n=1 Tax=Streptomyces sp. NBC_01236 TaxID=2903789 RepID=UPI002E0ED2CA|nr:hypothetical protein OG324_01895 [Streptomyces sp. NBC_01236]